MPAPKRPLYFMWKPPLAPAARIRSLPRAQRDRPPELLHGTLLGLFDRSDAPAWVLPRLVATMDGFRADAFDATFDRIQEWRCVVLRGGRALGRDVRALQAKLASHLAEGGFPLFSGPREPHVTINYRADGRGNAPIDPIGWQANEVVLVESIVGETRHVEHGRWPLG